MQQARTSQYRFCRYHQNQHRKPLPLSSKPTLQAFVVIIKTNTASFYHYHQNRTNPTPEPRKARLSLKFLIKLFSKSLWGVGQSPTVFSFYSSLYPIPNSFICKSFVFMG